MVELKPIKTEEEYSAAMKEIDRLWDIAKLGTPDGDYFDILFMLVEVYEKEHYPIEPPDPIEAIKHYMESRGLTNGDLVRYLGSPSRVSEVLNRKRSLTLSMIRNLEGLGIPASILVQKYDLNQTKSKKPGRRNASLASLIVGEQKAKDDDNVLLLRRKRDYGKELSI